MTFIEITENQELIHDRVKALIAETIPKKLEGTWDLEMAVDWATDNLKLLIKMVYPTVQVINDLKYKLEEDKECLSPK